MSISDPVNNPIQFAYWVPNVSGGLVISNIAQRTRWDIGYNRKLAAPVLTMRLRRFALPPAMARSGRHS